MDIALVFIVPLVIVALFLFSPVIIFYLTNAEKKYVRFSRIHKLQGVKKDKYDKWQKLNIRKAGGFFSAPVLFSLFFYFYIDTSEIIFLLLGLFHLVAGIYGGFSICYRLYQDYRGYRRMSRIFWSLNILLSIMISATGFNIILLIISFGLVFLWLKKTEFTLVYSLK